MKKLSDQILASLDAAFAALPIGTRKLLAVSGGLDSMLLLEAAYRLGQRNTVVLHVNHGLRGEESNGDEKFVGEAAQRYGMSILSTTLEWGAEKPSQASCRTRREEFFRSVLQPGEKVFLAHHLDDQAETIFLRLLRGTGVDGLKGMAPSSATKVRPWLGFTRAEILAVAKEWKLTWREDSSNASSKYERNWLRNEIFPLLNARRPGFSGRLAALTEEVRAIPVGAPASPNKILFTYEEGIAFSRSDQLQALGERGIKELFRLDRTHTKNLFSLLGKGSGECEAKGVRFRLSQGILLAERGKSFREELAWSAEGEMSVARGPLGEWKLAGAAADLRGAVAGGVSQKKKYQAAGIPQFFRSGMPVLSGPRATILVPGGAYDQVSFTPTRLGKWWITASVARGALGQKPSK